jgi:ABC-type antimicrobial peptide transport system permease subunit
VGVGLIVLLIALFNFVNLATAHASTRAREVGVRKSIGAHQRGLIGQFLGESVLLAVLAVMVSLLLAEVALPWFNQLTNRQLYIPHEQIGFWLSVAGTTLLVGLLAGTYPAFFLSSFRAVNTLKGIKVRPRGISFRKALVVMQFALSVVLIISTLVIYRQLRFVQNKKLGFDQSQLMYLRLKGDARGKAAVFKNELVKQMGVSAVTANTNNLVDVANSSYLEWEGQTPDTEFLITQMNTDPQFLTTTGIKLVAGRNFATATDTSDLMGRYLVNETAAKRMGCTNQTVLGKKVKFWGLTGEVIGVVKDFHFRPLSTAIQPLIVRFRPREFYFNLLIKTQPQNLPQTVAAIEKLYKKLDPIHPIAYGFVNQDVEAQYQSQQRTGYIMLYFTVLAIFIACLGLFGLATFTAEIRTKEIGIRKVLGASVTSLTALLSKDFLKLVTIAIMIASPIAYYCMEKWLENFAYRIEISWWVFVATIILTVSLAFLTVSYQAIRTALSNPVTFSKTGLYLA